MSVDESLFLGLRTTIYKVGDLTKEGDHIGPLFDKIQYDRVQAMIQLGIDEGAPHFFGQNGRHVRQVVQQVKIL